MEAKLTRAEIETIWFVFAHHFTGRSREVFTAMKDAALMSALEPVATQGDSLLREAAARFHELEKAMPTDAAWWTAGDRRAAKTMRAIDAYLAAPPTAAPSEWIPVSERLPEEGATVIGYWPGVMGGNTSTATVIYEPPHGWHDPEDEEDTFAEPSHWMLLPAAPTRSAP